MKRNTKADKKVYRLNKVWSKKLVLAMTIFLVSSCLNTSPTEYPIANNSSTVLPGIPSLTEIGKTISPTNISPTNTLPNTSASLIPGIVFALLADNSLAVINVVDGNILTQLRLAPAPPSFTGRGNGHYLSLSKDKKALYILVPGQADMVDHLAVVDTAKFQLSASYPIINSEGKLSGRPNSAKSEEGVYQSLAIGQLSDKVYLFGNRGGNVIVTKLDPSNGVELLTWVAKAADGYDWSVYQGAVTDDEKRFFVSYHGDATNGKGTTGIDWFEFHSGSIKRCSQADYPNAGCISSAHGSFLLYGDKILTATGMSRINEYDSTGTKIQTFDTQLENNHLMEFAVDSASQRLYAVGACNYVGGFSSVSLQKGGISTTPITLGETNWVVTPAPPLILQRNSICANKLILGPSSSLLLIDGSPELTLLDTSTGNIVKKIKAGIYPLDIIQL